MNFDKIKLRPAEKLNEEHRRGVWDVFNENIGFNLITSEPIAYEDHCKWWETAFENEYIYVILYDDVVSGYIRLTKTRTESKEKNEISIAVSKILSNSGLGSFAYQQFEKEMKKLGIKSIIALTNFKNELGKKFFEKNGFRKDYIRYVKDI